MGTLVVIVGTLGQAGILVQPSMVGFVWSGSETPAASHAARLASMHVRR
jgi:hypothetical protein